MVSISPEILRLSAFKETEDNKGILIRVYNPTKKCIDGSILFNFLINEVYLCKLNEEKLEVLKIFNNNLIKIKVKSFEIISIRLIF